VGAGSKKRKRKLAQEAGTGGGGGKAGGAHTKQKPGAGSEPFLRLSLPQQVRL